MTELQLYKRVEMALLRLNPKMLGVNNEVAWKPKQDTFINSAIKSAYFCTYGALRASERTAERVPSDYYFMIGLLEVNPFIKINENCLKTRITTSALRQKLKRFNGQLIELTRVNDTFMYHDMTNKACDKRYKYMLGWIRNKIKTLDKSSDM